MKTVMMTIIIVIIIIMFFLIRQPKKEGFCCFTFCFPNIFVCEHPFIDWSFTCVSRDLPIHIIYPYFFWASGSFSY